MKKIKTKLDGCCIYIGYPLERIGEKLKDKKFGEKVFILTDKNVSRIYGKVVEESIKRAGKEVFLFEIEPGEGSKSFENSYRIIKECSKFGMERIDTIVSLGGGVVTDIGGFVSSIYLRGINSVYVPTTLLAQVDAAIGGKTGVNLPWGKNLIGSFYQPNFIYIDLETLSTLPHSEIIQGLAEVIKYGVIKDEEFFEFLEKFDYESIRKRYNYIIEKSIKIKIGIVEKDEKEEGLREILNFGHTLGHAIEISNLGKYNHGEAVALGMVGETYLSCEMGICKKDVLKRIINVLKKYHLPYDLRKVKIMDIGEFMDYDKKRRFGKLRFVLPERIGKVRRGVEIDKDFIVKKWEEIDKLWID